MFRNWLADDASQFSKFQVNLVKVGNFFIVKTFFSPCKLFRKYLVFAYFFGCSAIVLTCGFMSYNNIFYTLDKTNVTVVMLWWNLVFAIWSTAGRTSLGMSTPESVSIISLVMACC